MKKICDNCINRLICPTRQINKPENICDGFNNENVFIGLSSLTFNINGDKIKRILKFIKNLQERGE